MSHRGHPDCPHATKSVCDKARREALGQCTAMTQAKAPTQCSKWGQSLVDGKPICDMHAEALLNAQIARDTAERLKAEMQVAIDEYLAWVKDHPSVWDPMPR